VTETEAILRLVSEIDSLDEKPRIRLVQIQEQSQFHFLHSLLLLVVGVIFGISLAVLWRGM